MAEPRRRFLIVCFDGLRPDMATPELMPNLTGFADAGVRFSQSRATFPSETRVNQAALVTGCTPARHGIVGNRFLDPLASPGRPLNTGDETQLAAADRRLDGRLMDAPALGEVLARHDMRLAVVSAGTPGGTRILHHRAERLGGFRLSLHRPDASVPADRVAATLRRQGPIPEYEVPSLAWLTYATDAALHVIAAESAPEVCILWLCEPDSSYHHLGLGSPPNLAAMHRADAEFGRILAWRADAGIGHRLQVITLSDHGHLTVSGAPVDVAGALAGAGFTAGATLAQGAEAAVALDSAGGIYVRQSDPDLIGRIVAFLQEQDWCGPVFTRNGAGALSHAQVGIAHPRAPDIALALSSDDSVNEHGVAGSSRHDSSYPLGGGLHGGLHRKELHNWMAADGDAFRTGHVSALPSGVIDVMPTLLHLLEIAIPASVQGRVLREALVAHQDEPLPEASHETVTAEGAAGHRTHLSRTRVARTTYLNRGWVD